MRTVAAAGAGGGAAVYFAHVCGARSAGDDRRPPCRRQSALRRGAAQLPVLLARRLRQAGRRANTTSGWACGRRSDCDGALARLARRPAVHACDRRVHDLVRGQDGRHRHRVDSRRPRRGSRRAGSSASRKVWESAGSRCGVSSRSLRRTPARVSGLYPRKGVIAPGSDADLVIWDPAVERTITIDDLHHEGDYSPWEGWQVRGWPTTTILRGRIAVDGGALLVEPGLGESSRESSTPKCSSSPGSDAPGNGAARKLVFVLVTLKLYLSTAGSGWFQESTRRTRRRSSRAKSSRDSVTTDGLPSATESRAPSNRS